IGFASRRGLQREQSLDEARCVAGYPADDVSERGSVRRENGGVALSYIEGVEAVEQIRAGGLARTFGNSEDLPGHGVHRAFTAPYRRDVRCRRQSAGRASPTGVSLDDRGALRTGEAS